MTVALVSSLVVGGVSVSARAASVDQRANASHTALKENAPLSSSEKIHDRTSANSRCGDRPASHWRRNGAGELAKASNDFTGAIGV